MECFPWKIRFSLALIIAKKEGDCAIYPLGDNFGDENVQQALKLELSQEARTHAHPADDHSTCVRSAGCLILTQSFSALPPLPAPCSSKCICMYHIMYQWICMYLIPGSFPMGSLAGDQKAGAVRSLSISSRLPPYTAVASLAGVSPFHGSAPAGLVLLQAPALSGHW